MTTSTEVDPESAAEVAAAERDLAEAEREIAAERKRPRGNGTAALMADRRRSAAVMRLERATRRAEFVHAQLHPLSDLEKARTAVEVAERVVDDLMRQPPTDESTDRLLAAGARRDRAKLVLQRQETYAAETSAAAENRAALVETHGARIGALREALAAKRTDLAAAMKARELVQVGAAVDDYNDELGKAHAQLTGLGLAYFSETDRTGAARHGAVVIDGEVWPPVQSSLALLWVASQAIRDRGASVPVIDGALKGVLGVGSASFGARQPGLMAAINPELLRRGGRRGGPSGPQAA